ncbi:MAG: NADP-dependent phosphogluconate dehydrogenase, partial [Caulobacteraceae bacterium]
GTSGGVWGLDRGFCLMVGGETAAFEAAEPIFSALAPGPGDIPRTRPAAGSPARAERGYIHAGPSGAGHFVKMVHNGIEYGLMQAYAEGFDLLRADPTAEPGAGIAYDLNLADVAEVWRRGSVIGSWLLDLIAAGLAEDGELETFSGVVADTGEGRWTLEAAVERSTPMPALAAALFARFRSRQDHTFADKLLSAMRMGFGGHKEIAGQAGGRNDVER